MPTKSVSESRAAAVATPESSELEKKDRLALLFREAVQQKKTGVILIFEGSGVAGILYTIHRLCQVLDPRHYDVHRFPDMKSTESSTHLPPLHEYWCKLPILGDLAIFDGSYYYKAICGKFDRKGRKQFVEEIQNFERTLADNGYLVLKIRVDRHKKDLKKELKKDRASILRKSILQRRLRRLFKDFDGRVKDLKRIVRKTDTAHAPWFSPPADDVRSVAMTVFDYLIARLEEDLSVDSRSAVAEFDEAMERVRRMRQQTTAKPSITGEST